MTKPVVLIKDWCIAPASICHPSYGRTHVLYGIPSNHPNSNPEGFVSNKKTIMSSKIVKKELNNQRVETLNTIYQLVGPAITKDELLGRVKKH